MTHPTGKTFRGEPLADRVHGLIRRMFPGVPEKLGAEMRLHDDLGLDSLDSIELLMAAEEEFHVYFDDGEAEQLVTVGDAVAAVERKLEAVADERAGVHDRG